MPQLDLLSTPTPLALRDYQERSVAQTLDCLSDNPILVAPTGSGKTVMGAEIVRRNGGRTLWVAHRQELIDQAGAALSNQTGCIVGYIKAGMAPDPSCEIQVASVQTLSRRSWPNVDLVVIDECHHAIAQQYRSLLDHYAGVPIIGLTATPFRLDGRGLGSCGFRQIVVAAYTDNLCADGALHAPKVFAGRAPDLTGVSRWGGDYAAYELAERVKAEGLVGDIVETWLAKTPGRRTVVFATDIQHSQMIVDRFRAVGVTAEHIDGKASREERQAIAHRLRTGETTVVSNVAVWTEGFDLPSIEVAIVARPTASLCLHLQMIGRIMRSHDGKDSAVVLDHAGNHIVHGLVTRRIEYSLDGRVAGNSEPLGMRTCPDCYLLVAAADRTCPDCGHEFTAEPRNRRNREVRNSDGDLVEYDENSFENKAAVYALLYAQAQASGFKPGWAAYRYKERFGEWPLAAEGMLIDPANATADQKRGVYLLLCQQAKEFGYKPGWAAHQFKERFGVWPHGFAQDVQREVFGCTVQSAKSLRIVATLNARRRGQPIPVTETETSAPTCVIGEDEEWYW